jgi:hypothetical protein
MSFSMEQPDSIPQMVDTLADEVNRISAKEEEALGLEECFKKVCKVSWEQNRLDNWDIVNNSNWTDGIL